MKTCPRCERRAVRRIKGAKYCSACVGRMPKGHCNDCGEDKFPDMMSTRFRCTSCHRDAVHSRLVELKYALAPGQYQELLLFQGGKSAISGQRPGTKRLAVDHDHKTGKVRGLLTKHENLYIIGWAERFEDPVAVLQKAIEYLIFPPASQLWDHPPVVPKGYDGSTA